MNQLTPEDVEWKLDFRYKTTEDAHSKYRDKRFGIQKEVITKRISQYEWGSSKTYYFIDNVRKEFTDLQLLCDCWNENNNYDEAMKRKEIVLSKEQYAAKLAKEWREINPCNHSWRNSGLKIQGVSQKICLHCGEKQPLYQY